jgi:8-amino-7-oxononanoate synthase
LRAVTLTWLETELAELEDRGLIRSPRLIAEAIGPETKVDGRLVLLFCSNDYLGLAGHPALRRAAIETIERLGVGAGSSRLISGTQAPHRRLERRLARWLGSESALTMPTGFMTNLAVITTLAGPEDVIFSDALNHASIVQGCRLSRAEVVVYPHNDHRALARLMAATRARRRLLVTDAVFSVDGDVAPIEALGALARQQDATLIVDEAHSLGVIGPRGRGLCAEAGVVPDVLVGTFGKAFGCSGAFVAGSAQLVTYLESRAVPYIYTTAAPPLLAAVAEAALEQIIDADAARSRLMANAERLRVGLTSLGADCGAARHHIVPSIVPGVKEVLALSAALFDQGVFTQALRQPTVPRGAERLRWTPTSLHTDAHIAQAIEAYSKVSALRRADSSKQEQEQ